MDVLSKVANEPLPARLERYGIPILGLATSLTVVVVLWRAQGLVDSRPDPYMFSAMAESLVRGDGFAPFGSLLHRRTPLYPLFVAGIYALFGSHELPVQLAQCLLFAGTCWFVQDLGRMVYSRRVGVIAGVLCAFHPSLLRYVPDFHLETLLTFLFTLSIWLSVRFYRQPSAKHGVLLGVVWGLASLTKAVVLLYPAVFAAFWWLRLTKFAKSQPVAERAASRRAALVPLAIALLAMGLTISPWTARNYAVTGKFVPITTGMSDAILRGFVFSRTEFITLQKPPYTDAENEVNAYFRALCEKQGAVWEADDLQTEAILKVEARKKLLGEPLLFVRKCFVGIFTFWYQMTNLKTSLAAGSMALVAWVFAGIGLRRSWTERQPVWLLLAPILYLNAILAALLALGRYSVPVLPCLIVMAAFGVDTLLRRRATAKDPEGAPA
jgi:4-amino-4-deoxy-L-arabinose transferase-like glycosyltransferase